MFIFIQLDVFYTIKRRAEKEKHTGLRSCPKICSPWLECGFLVYIYFTHTTQHVHNMTNLEKISEIRKNWPKRSGDDGGLDFENPNFGRESASRPLVDFGVLNDNLIKELILCIK
jgi:hypothetical protein